MAAGICGHFSFHSDLVSKMVRLEKGFSLAELLLIVALIGALAAIAVPRLDYAVVDKSRADVVSRKMMTDMRRTRSLAISEAARNTSGFGLFMTGSSPYDGYNIRDIETGATVDSHTIDSAVECTGGSEFRFGPLGNLLSGSDTEFEVSASGRTVTVSVTAATGMVKCTTD